MEKKTLNFDSILWPHTFRASASNYQHSWVYGADTEDRDGVIVRVQHVKFTKLNWI